MSLICIEEGVTSRQMSKWSIKIAITPPGTAVTLPAPRCILHSLFPFFFPASCFCSLAELNQVTFICLKMKMRMKGSAVMWTDTLPVFQRCLVIVMKCHELVSVISHQMTCWAANEPDAAVSRSRMKRIKVSFSCSFHNNHPLPLPPLILLTLAKKETFGSWLSTEWFRKIKPQGEKRKKKHWS